MPPPLPAYGRAMAGQQGQGLFPDPFRRRLPGREIRLDARTWTPSSGLSSWQLNALKTDYIDFGFLHCLDEEADLQKRCWTTACWTYIQQLQQEGTVRHIGLSSHTPRVAQPALDTGHSGPADVQHQPGL